MSKKNILLAVAIIVSLPLFLRPITNVFNWLDAIPIEDIDRYDIVYESIPAGTESFVNSRRGPIFNRHTTLNQNPMGFLFTLGILVGLFAIWVYALRMLDTILSLPTNSEDSEPESADRDDSAKR